MDLRKIKKLIELFEASALVEMEITEGENTIRLSRASARAPLALSPLPQEAPPVALAPAPADAPPPGELVKSPLVGTFFGSPSPGEKPYVEVGSRVNKGDALCLVEAMKTFNRVDAEVAGVVTVIHRKNGDPVEYGEPLFVIDTGGAGDA